MAEGLPRNKHKISWDSLRSAICPERVGLILLADPSLCGQTFKFNSKGEWANADNLQFQRRK